MKGELNDNNFTVVTSNCKEKNKSSQCSYKFIRCNYWNIAEYWCNLEVNGPGCKLNTSTFVVYHRKYFLRSLPCFFSGDAFYTLIDIGVGIPSLFLSIS